jgi:hypothetical protein
MSARDLRSVTSRNDADSEEVVPENDGSHIPLIIGRHCQPPLARFADNTSVTFGPTQPGVGRLCFLLRRLSSPIHLPSSAVFRFVKNYYRQRPRSVRRSGGLLAESYSTSPVS